MPPERPSQPDIVQADGFWERLRRPDEPRTRSAASSPQQVPLPAAPQPAMPPSGPAEPPSPKRDPLVVVAAAADAVADAVKGTETTGWRDPRPGGAIGVVMLIADSPIGDWVYRNFLKPRPRDRGQPLDFG